MCYWFIWDNLAYARRKPKTKLGKQMMIAITEPVSEMGEDVPLYTAAAASPAPLAFASTPHLCKLQLLHLLLLLLRLLSLHLLLLLPPRCCKMQGCILCPCTWCQIPLLMQPRALPSNAPVLAFYNHYL